MCCFLYVWNAPIALDMIILVIFICMDMIILFLTMETYYVLLFFGCFDVHGQSVTRSVSTGSLSRNTAWTAEIPEYAQEF